MTGNRAALTELPPEVLDNILPAPPRPLSNRPVGVSLPTVPQGGLQHPHGRALAAVGRQDQRLDGQQGARLSTRQQRSRHVCQPPDLRAQPQAPRDGGAGSRGLPDQHTGTEPALRGPADSRRQERVQVAQTPRGQRRPCRLSEWFIPLRRGDPYITNVPMSSSSALHNSLFFYERSFF
jgi:hypothetical protein